MPYLAVSSVELAAARASSRPGLPLVLIATASAPDFFSSGSGTTERRPFQMCMPWRAAWRRPGPQGRKIRKTRDAEQTAGLNY